MEEGLLELTSDDSGITTDEEWLVAAPTAAAATRRVAPAMVEAAVAHSSWLGGREHVRLLAQTAAGHGRPWVHGQARPFMMNSAAVCPLPRWRRACCGSHPATGLGLPPLDLTASQFGGVWASASSLVFTDLMKHSTPFTAGSRSSTSTGTFGYLNPASITWRPDGYPAGLSPPSGQQWCAATTIGAGRGYYPAGRYVVLYDGVGAVELDGDARVPPVTATAGRLEVDVVPSATGLRVRITASSSTNPLRNLRIVPMVFEATHNTTQVFHPTFLAMLQGVPLLRFAPWMRATWNENNGRAAPRSWTARTTPTHSSQVREADGVAVEHLVHLANTVNASMWISLPRAANNSDTYTYGMMSYIATNLAPWLTVTVEYGVDGPGWLSSHLPTNTKLLGGIARRAWAAAGRPPGQLRVSVSAPHVNAASNILGNLGSNFTSWLDALALPASFGGMSYFSWGGRNNPTGWNDPAYFLTPRPELTLEQALKLLRSSVIAADVSYNKQFQVLRSRGLQVLGYAAGPELIAPTYGARGNVDGVLVGNCKPPPATTVWPCTYTRPIFPPWASNGGPGTVTWANLAARDGLLYGALATNASREAALESLLRQVRLHDSVYDMVLDSLWRWHYQMGGGDVIVDVTRLAKPCSEAPGLRSYTYAPDECCNTTATATIVANPDRSPTYRALRAWLAAERSIGGGTAIGALPRSAAQAPPAVPPAVSCNSACVYGTCSYEGKCECWAGASGPNCSTLSPRSTPSACNPRIGINLEGIADWSRSWAFIDVFKASRKWIPQTFSSYVWDTKLPLNLITSPGVAGPSAVGYPASLGPDQKASTLVVRDLLGHVPGGVYTVLYDGKGALDFSMSDVKDVVYVEAGHVRVTFQPSTDLNNGILVMIERTDPADPIRNIRVIMPGFERAAAAGSAFHPAFLEFLRPFGALRFMEWMHTNVDPLPVSWSDRPRVDDRSYAVSAGGVPLELMVQLANILGADPWFNMPHAASDDYIARFAAAVRDTLRPDLKVYVEYSNEVWHTGFPGGKYAQAMGLTMNLTEEGSKWYGGANNEARLCFAGQRTANISRIWKSVWGPRGTTQVVIVVSGQAVWPITSDKLLGCRGAHRDIDALAIAPYFGSYDKTRDKSLEVFLSTTLPAQIGDMMSYVTQHSAIAAKYGKPLLTYEAGQGLIGDGSATDLAIQANRHPAMTGLYRTYMGRLAANNVSRVMHFSSIGAYSQYGSWGLMEMQDDDKREAPKYQGLMSYLNDTLQCLLPPPPNPAKCPGAGCSGNGECLRNGQCMCYSGFSGPDCSTSTYTDYKNCGYKCTFDQGWCTVSSLNRTTRNWSCTCKPGISGLTCAIVACPRDCSWNGECLDQGICACYQGYRGADCSQDCGCGGHGRCDDNGSCVCDVGWRLGAQGKCEWDCSGCDTGVGCIGPGECGCAETCVYGTCFDGRCRCWAGYGGPACNISDADATTAPAGTTFVPRANRGSLAGVNLGGLAYYSTDWVWIDVMKGSSRWFTTNARDTSLSSTFDTGAPLELRPDGYPARLPNNTVAHKLLLRNVQLHAWPGRYVVLYEGDGRLDFDFDAKVVSRAKGRLEIVYTPTADLVCAATGAAYCGDNGIHLILTATNPANPLRDIRILPSVGAPAGASAAGGPGAGGAWERRHGRTPFHPWFLRSVARYRTLRFMPWLNTNNNVSWAAAAGGSAWSRRTTPSYDTQARDGGAALEHIVALCNVLGAEPWITVHHLADDGYVAAMAAMLRDSLRPDVRVMVEHSNEVWNSLFSQHAFARARGLALWPSLDPLIAAYRYHALRTAQIAEIFRTAFASAPGGGAARVKAVLGGWGYLCGGYCGERVIRETLGWSDTASKVDYYGVTGYWDCGLGRDGPAESLLSLEQMIAKCDAALSTTEAAATAVVAAVAPYGVPLITYEAGPSLVEASSIQYGTATETLTTKLVALNRHPEMYRLYGSYLEAFRRAGLVGEDRPWMQFVNTGMPSKYGSWGLQEYTGQDPATAPKYRALMDWLDAQRPAGRRPRCLALAAAGGAAGGVAGTAGGGMALGEGMLMGPPAVNLPAAGQVLVQGRSYTARWSTVGWPAGPSRPLELTLWFDSDCDGSETVPQQQRPASQALFVLKAGTALDPAGELTWRVPLPLELPALATAVAAASGGDGGAVQRNPRFFLRISDGVTTNYSEPFDIQPPYVYVAGPWSECDCASLQQSRTLTCRANTAASSSPPDLAPPEPSPFCAIYPGWNISLRSGGDPPCTIDPVTGCRTYYTSNLGAWAFSIGKPVIDCISQTSPWPRLYGSSGDSGAVSLNYCTSAGVAAPAVTRSCPPADAAAMMCSARVFPSPPYSSLR